MRYFQGIPEDFLREAFEYDPDSPSCLVRLRTRQEQRDNTNHFCKRKGSNSLRADIGINGKKYCKYFPFGRNDKPNRKLTPSSRKQKKKTRKLPRRQDLKEKTDTGRIPLRTRAKKLTSKSTDSSSSSATKTSTSKEWR